MASERQYFTSLSEGLDKLAVDQPPLPKLELRKGEG